MDFESKYLKFTGMNERVCRKTRGRSCLLSCPILAAPYVESQRVLVVNTEPPSCDSQLKTIEEDGNDDDDDDDDDDVPGISKD